MTTQALPIPEIESSIQRFIHWLQRYGETSHDFQSFYANPIGRRAKALYYRWPLLGTIAVAPMVFCEAFVPRARTLFWKRLRFPIADAHYAMGFAFLSRVSGDEAHYKAAIHFLEVLESTRCPGYERHGWGYPFDWETRTGTIPANTPLITTLGYAYEAFREVYAIDKDDRWRKIMYSAAQHALLDYRDHDTIRDASSCAYTPAPDDPGGIVNASAYRAALLTKAALDFAEPSYAAAAERNLRFVLASQNADGSWHYAVDGVRDFVDHFHTCFVLKALAAIETITHDRRCTDAIERGVRYYLDNLFDAEGLPKPFARAPRLTVYRRELYDYAECLNLAAIFRRRFDRLDQIFTIILRDVLQRWQSPEGAFRSRKLLIGWDNVPMHRWAQAQLFRSLSLLLHLSRAA